MKVLLVAILLLVPAPSFAQQDDCPPGHVRHPAVSALDDASMLAAYTASFRGIQHREPTLVPGSGIDDGWYYIRQSNHFGVYGDDQCHAGWSGYWESWLQYGHGDLTLVQSPARFQPGTPTLPPQPPITPPVQPPPVVIDLSGVLARLDLIAATLNEQVRADGDAHAAINQNITDGRNEARPVLEAVKDALVFVTKYVLPPVTAWIIAKQTKAGS